MKINRRKYPRMHEDIVIDVEFGNVIKYRSNVMDISLGGIRMKGAPDYQAEQGETCRVIILDQPVSVSFSVTGEIVWLEKDYLGIKFTEISSDAKRMLNSLISDLSYASMQGQHTVAVG